MIWSNSSQLELNSIFFRPPFVQFPHTLNIMLRCAKFSANSSLGISLLLQKSLFSVCQTVLSLVSFIDATKEMGTNGSVLNDLNKQRNKHIPLKMVRFKHWTEKE